jgi:hypothetical protein
MQDSRRLFTYLCDLAILMLWEPVRFVPLGIAAVIALTKESQRRQRFPINLSGLLLSFVLVALVKAIEFDQPWHVSAVVRLILPLIGCLFGLWIGTTWFRGRRARLLLLPKLVLLSLLISICGGVFIWRSVDTTPMAFDAAAVTSDEKRRLVKLIRNKSPRSLGAEQTHTLQLTNHDINVLLSWGLSLGSADRKAKVGLARDYASLLLSVGLKLGESSNRYLNLELDGNIEIKDGNPSLRLYGCRLGSMKAPGWLLTHLGPALTSFINESRLSKPFMDAIRSVSIKPDAIEVTYGPVDMPADFREDIFGSANASEEVLATTRMQVENLLALAGRSPDAPPSFAMCFETVFALARERSVERDPVIENRAGIFALGVLLGHHRIQEFLGWVLRSSDNRAARRALQRVTVRGRSDWTKHFCVSAALTLLSDSIVSDAAGLLKEELDADIGGSGFSFADLLADRAGTTFASFATRDAEAARKMQDRIAGGFKLREVFPPAGDLPEGIDDAELQSRYGGIGGKLYLRIMKEIERRIATCAAYR